MVPPDVGLWAPDCVIYGEGITVLPFMPPSLPPEVPLDILGARLAGRLDALLDGKLDEGLSESSSNDPDVEECFVSICGAEVEERASIFKSPRVWPGCLSYALASGGGSGMEAIDFM